MNTTELKKFAQAARRQLIEQVGARLDLALQTDSAELREQEKALRQLRDEIGRTSRAAVIERVAYTWFNRFCALRYMDVNRYTKIGAVSPAEGFLQPEIVQDAKQGLIDDDLQVDKQKIFDLLAGRISSSDPQQEAYRLLLVAVCNSYHKLMPFMFERIADYTELLMPDDLLSENSILRVMREAMTQATCRDVEVIGWLYQFYIAEKKDQVFAGLKKNKKIAPENIPAATQLFTPHWIVRYLVENSLGRLWMLNHPDSGLIEQMEYYIKPEESETDFLKINSPEEIKICDPACGSGHMLTYAFDLLYAIYEEDGYDAAQIPQLILTNNLYGIEIDARAGELAAFALFMKAREKYRRFFRKPVQPNICILENVEFEEGELTSGQLSVVGDQLKAKMIHDLHLFREADNFGSLLQPELSYEQFAEIRGQLTEHWQLNTDNLLFDAPVREKITKALLQAEYLASRYHVVIANPPYMGGKGMNGRLKTYLKDHFSDVKSDLFAAFMVRNTELTLPKGQLGVMTPFVWMFISSYAKLRHFLINQKTITSLVQLEYSGFDGATVPICTFTAENAHRPEFRGGYIRLSNFRGSENQALKTLEAIKNPDCGWFYRAPAADFKKIPGCPIAYWFSGHAADNCDRFPSLAQYSDAKSGMSSCNSILFLRQWFEVSNFRIKRNAKSHSEANTLSAKWYPYNKGGGNRCWFGYNNVLINWENGGQDIKSFVINNPKDPNTTHWSRRLFNLDYFFKDGLTWSAVTSGRFSCRVVPHGIIPGTGSKTLYDLKGGQIKIVFSLLNTTISSYYLSAFSPTLNFEAGDVVKIPIIEKVDVDLLPVDELVNISQQDWDFYETSWDFTELPLLSGRYTADSEAQEKLSTSHSPLPTVPPSLSKAYTSLRSRWAAMTLQMQRLEEENNRIFIEAYGLQDELTPEVPLSEITLTCNPHYRYGGNKTEEELEAKLLADTMKEFISYSVGCMFGRYSLDKPGLVLANQGETVDDYLKQSPEPTFEPDTDNVIPILDGQWFPDDIAERFKTFLKITLGWEHFDENLKFIEEAIGKNIRKYFLIDFYKDHVRTYKKRPIYWLFSSPGCSFNALIYLHRYRPDTASIILNDYLREFRTKLIAGREHLEQVSISAAATKTEKTKALKEIEKLKKIIEELDTYENEILYPLATEKIEIDLDDGVKVNYKKFGKALKKVAGLN